MEELSDRLHITDNRGSKNTNLVGMDPVEGVVTIMVERSASHDVPWTGHRMTRGGGSENITMGGGGDRSGDHLQDQMSQG